MVIMIDCSYRSFKAYEINSCTFQVPLIYEAETIIGGGSHGVVFKATNCLSKEKIAIKRLRYPFVNTEEAKRTYREMELLKNIKHRNIVSLIDIYTPQENLKEFIDIYIVLEYVDYSLRSLIHDRHRQFQTPYGARQLSYIIYQLLCAVNYLHQNGIVHKDITPENIMIDRKFQVKIVDLGSANSVDSTNQRSIYTNQRYYQAPEMILSQKCDYKVDVWSIGCVFAELVTGNILCKSKDRYDQYIQIIKIFGTPTDDFTIKLDDVVRKHLNSLPKFEPTPWMHLFSDCDFPESEKKFCNAKNGRDLLSKMLKIDPGQRISSEQALKHSYVSWKDIKNKDFLHSSTMSSIKCIDKMKLSSDEWKRVLFEKVNYTKDIKNKENEQKFNFKHIDLYGSLKF